MKGKILLTGYEPFLDMKVNPSMEAIRLLDGMEYHGYEVVIEELPMRYAEVRDIIRGHVDKHKPAAVICTGVSSIGTGIAVERVAINVGSADNRPNFGYERLDQILNPDGPVAYWSTLPIREIVEETGHPRRVYPCTEASAERGRLHEPVNEPVGLSQGD
jgi:pyroglutamyl-peptidase